MDAVSVVPFLPDLVSSNMRCKQFKLHNMSEVDNACSKMVSFSRLVKISWKETANVLRGTSRVLINDIIADKTQ